MGPKKQQKMSLGTFLGDQSLGSWADEMEDQPLPSTDSKTGYGSTRSYDSKPSFGGSGAGSSIERMGSGFEGRGYQREQLPLPTKPPYTAHLGNLSWDVTSEDIEKFFDGCEVTNVRIVEDRVDHKPKGFGYVEFGSLDGLKKALTLSGTSFQNRDVRVSVAEPPKERQEARELNDWTRKGPLPDAPQRRIPDRTGGPPARNFDPASDAANERIPRRGPLEGADGRVRDFGNWERKGPLTPSLPSPGAPPRRESAGGPRGTERSFDRKESPASWGEGRSQEGSRPRRAERPERPERTPTAADMDNQWRSRMKPDAPAGAPASPPPPEASTPTSPSAPAAAAPASRPKLNLQKRTVSEAPTAESASATDAKASPFGAARPVNTFAREQEAEEKRRQRRAEEDKAREEKKATEKAERAERPDRKQSSSGQEKSAKKEENGATSPGGGRPQYEILRRMQDGEESGEPEDGAPDESANGTIIDDKAVKPKEIVRDIKTGQTNDEPATEELDNGGWSTVPVQQKRKGKNSRGGSRAIAS